MSDRGHDPSSAYADPRPGPGKGAGAVMTGGIEHLDFGVRNTLLYYKDLKTTLDLTPGSGANRGAVERLLGAERVPVSELFDADGESLRNATKRVRSISYRARRDGDKGSPGTLCIAWGLATWDNGRAAVPAAPIVLRQAAVGRHPGTAEDFDLTVSGPWNLNVTLLRLLEIDFGVDVERAALNDLVDELVDSGDPQALFERVAKTASAVPGFSISPRVVLAPVPRIAMVVSQAVIRDTAPIEDIRSRTPVDIGPDSPLDDATVDDTSVDDRVNDHRVNAAGGVADRVADEEVAVEAAGTAAAFEATTFDPEPAPDTEVTAGTIELFLAGKLNPKTMAPGSMERRIIERSGADAIIADITMTLRGDNWPESLIEHADSGLRVRDRHELLQRWYDAGVARPRPSGWDATHFALWGLTAAPPVGDPALRAVARWGERRLHPVLMAWHTVAAHRSQARRRLSLPSKRVSFPRGLDEALWGLPVDLSVEWAAWVFRQWPGAPTEFVLPAGTPELVSAWYERARPVAELAVKTWIPFAGVDDALGRAANRWVKQLTSACAGGGAPLATWFERSTAVATEAVAQKLGDQGPAGRRLGRRTTVTHAEHAI
jgi:hypothetical protein